MTKATIKGVHPLADLFPMMSGPELKALAADIKANGQQEPGKVTADGLLAEGRNRREACKLAGVEFEYEVIGNGTNVGDMIVSANIFRRNMTNGQIAILAVVAELGIELPGKDVSPGLTVDTEPRTHKKYDYQVQAHKRVEGLVTPTLIKDAVQIIRWAPDHARSILETGEGWKKGRETAIERSKEANSEEERRKKLEEDSPDLLAQVSDNGGITLAEAWRLREGRIRQERETRSRLTGYFVERIKPLINKGSGTVKETVDNYDPDYANGIGVAEIDEAIGYLQELKAEFKRQKKG